MTKEEIIQAIVDDKTMPFIQPEQLSGIVDFVIKNYKPSLPTIKGWVARDKNGSLTFFSVKPIKFEEYAERWYVFGACTTCYLGFCDFYKDLKWEDEPIEVELIIRPL